MKTMIDVDKLSRELYKRITRVKESIEKLAEKHKHTVYYDVDVNFFVTNAVFCRIIDDEVTVVTRQGLILKVTNNDITVESINECYCGDCVCKE